MIHPKESKDMEAEMISARLVLLVLSYVNGRFQLMINIISIIKTLHAAMNLAKQAMLLK